MHDRVGRIVRLGGRRSRLAVTSGSAPTTTAAALAGAGRASSGLIIMLAVGAIGPIRLGALVRDIRRDALGALAAGLTAAAAATATSPAARALSAIVASAPVSRAVLAVAVLVTASRDGSPGIRARRLVGLGCAGDRDLGRLEDHQRRLERHRGWRGCRNRLALPGLCLAMVGLAGLAPGRHVPCRLLVCRLLVCRLLLCRLLLCWLLLCWPLLGRLTLGDLVLRALLLCLELRGWLRFGWCGLGGPAAA